MFFWRKTRAQRYDEIEARLSVIETRMRRLERRWAPADQRGIEDALASLARAGGFTYGRTREDA